MARCSSRRVVTDPDAVTPLCPTRYFFLRALRGAAATCAANLASNFSRVINEQQEANMERQFTSLSLNRSTSVGAHNSPAGDFVVIAGILSWRAEGGLKK